MPWKMTVLHVWVYIIPKQKFKRPNHVIKVQHGLLIVEFHCSPDKGCLCVFVFIKIFQPRRIEERTFVQSLFPDGVGCFVLVCVSEECHEQSQVTVSPLNTGLVWSRPGCQLTFTSFSIPLNKSRYLCVCSVFCSQTWNALWLKVNVVIVAQGCLCRMNK